MRREMGFTLIELLVVVAILGIISSIAIANLLNALDKGKQKRSMADIHSIGEAIESYGVDMGFYPKGANDWNALQGYLSPYFIKNPPVSDGWANSWIAATGPDGADYTVASLGKDGVQGSWSGGMTQQFNCDIVFSSGTFFQWPQGTQT